MANAENAHPRDRPLALPSPTHQRLLCSQGRAPAHPLVLLDEFICWQALLILVEKVSAALEIFMVKVTYKVCLGLAPARHERSW